MVAGRTFATKTSGTAVSVLRTTKTSRRRGRRSDGHVHGGLQRSASAPPRTPRRSTAGRPLPELVFEPHLFARSAINRDRHAQPNHQSRAALRYGRSARRLRRARIFCHRPHRCTSHIRQPARPRAAGCVAHPASKTRSVASGSRRSVGPRTSPPLPACFTLTTIGNGSNSRCERFSHGVFHWSAGNLRQPVRRLPLIKPSPEIEHCLLFLVLRSTSHERCLRWFVAALDHATRWARSRTSPPPPPTAATPRTRRGRRRTCARIPAAPRRALRGGAD